MAKTSITAKLGLDTTAFQRGMAKSQKSVSNFVKNGIAKFGALAGAAGLGAMARAAIDLGSKISDLAVQLNIGTTELQVLDFAAREAGVGTEIMARALRNVQLRTEEAIKGNKSYGDAFVQLGINVNEFKKLSVEKRLEAIAVAQSKATDKAAAYNAVSRILGEKAGPALQEVLQNLAGPKGYGGLEAAAERAGEVMSEETIAKMDAAADKIESFKRKMTVLAAEILTKIVPAFSIFGNGLGSVGDIVGSLIGKFSSFLGFLGRSVSATINPVIKQFESLAMGLKGVAESIKNPKKAMESFRKSMALQKESMQSLVSIPKKIASEYKRANEEMEIDNKHLDRSMQERSDKITKAWAEMWGENVDTTKKANADILENTRATTITATGKKSSKAKKTSGPDVAATTNDGPEKTKYLKAVEDLKALRARNETRATQGADEKFSLERDRPKSNIRSAHEMSMANARVINAKSNMDAQEFYRSKKAKTDISAAVPDSKSGRSNSEAEPLKAIASTSREMAESLKSIQREVSGG